MPHHTSQPTERYFALTGMPRSGTTYLAAVLHRPPHVVTMSEAGGAWKQLFQAHAADAEFRSVFNQTYAAVEGGESVATLEGTPGFEGHGRIDTWNQKSGGVLSRL